MDGKIKSIGARRAIVLDVVHWGTKVPSFPVERWFEVGELAAARGEAAERFSWVTLFAKAYALAGKDVPELRQIYVGWPWPRVYQNPSTVVSVAVTRKLDNDERLFFGRLWSPDEHSLFEIQSQLDNMTKGPVEQAFKQQWRAAKFPLPVRRLAWWWRMAIDYRQRGRRVGTGSISVLAGLGVTNRLHPCILTSSLSYGPIEDGRMWVTLQCDHRVIDGVVAARALNAIHEALNGQVLAELRQTAKRPQSRAA